MLIYQKTNSVASKDVTAIVRSVGERTEAACYNLLAQQVPEKNIVIINEAPFSAAVAKTFQVGIERGLPWTLCVDADVLLREGAVTELLAAAEQASDRTFEIQAKVLDRFFGGARPAGNHLYRTSLMSQALNCIPAEGVSLRPETYTIKEMAARGFPWIQKQFVVGLHDYEQFYKDIYRVAFTHAKKHRRYISVIEGYWQRAARDEADFEVALQGLQAGRVFEGSVALDIRKFSQDINSLLKTDGWQEKEPMESNGLSGATIAKTIKDFKIPPEYREFQLLQNSSNQKNNLKRFLLSIWNQSQKVLSK